MLRISDKNVNFSAPGDNALDAMAMTTTTKTTAMAMATKTTKYSLLTINISLSSASHNLQLVSHCALSSFLMLFGERV